MSFCQVEGMKLSVKMKRFSPHLASFFIQKKMKLVSSKCVQEIQLGSTSQSRKLLTQPLICLSIFALIATISNPQIEVKSLHPRLEMDLDQVQLDQPSLGLENCQGWVYLQ